MRGLGAAYLSRPLIKLAHLFARFVTLLCARSDTTAAFWTLNNPFRQNIKPHKFPCTINFLNSAIRKLRAVEASGRETHGATFDLWRGMRNLNIGSSFSQEGVRSPSACDSCYSY